MSLQYLNFREKLIVVFIIGFILVSCQTISKLSSEPSWEEMIIDERLTPPGIEHVENSDSTPSPAPTSTPDKFDLQFPSNTPTNNLYNPTSTVSALLSATTIPSATPFPVTRFAVIGDYGLAGNPARDVSDMVKAWVPDFIITTGDNNYPDGMPETVDENIGQYYHAYIYPYIGKYGQGANINRFFPAMGNHDWSVTLGKTHYDYFTLPGNERYYDFTWGPVHLFAIDSDSREPDGVGRSSVQAEWLRDKLETSEAEWKIVYMHHPPYSSSGDDGSIDWMQWPFKEWGATAVLSGHSHVYERLIVDGFPYFVNGLGGGPRYTFNDPVPGSQVRFRNDYGAMLVEATKDQISFQFITRGNKIIDTFIIENSN